ncbi:DNA-binding MarR family transcriptional regulator [Microbacterium halimionae]|uniref:DNA-binding MarR family transcriptional regulator n=1 Tax=Microbacterium halimionae TaxID=1526413 RepID=A0A7W3JM65_9MICO|nr:MarR family transcriptional regulator [Microbacterium halimionae]MBA8815407.1 DNA-binding MarR family transcriptional regulator [Microbacterium halimionae]NII95454.1 DNA-binding MarR family transcriptional regulator [Microbacterium halimionae]
MTTDPATDSRSQAVRVLEAEMGELIVRFRTVIREAAERFSPGMHPGAYKMFTMIARRGPLTSSALSERSGIDKGLLSRTVRQLEDLGFIERTPDPDDGRSSLLSATAEGRARLEATRGTRSSHLAESLDTWSVENIQKLAVLLHALSTGEEPAQFEDLATPVDER